MQIPPVEPIQQGIDGGVSYGAIAVLVIVVLFVAGLIAKMAFGLDAVDDDTEDDQWD
jgi:hypothetical protein